MKQLLLIVTLACSVSTFAQTQTKPSDITSKNSWLKLGIDLGVPTGDASNFSSFVAGVDVKGQLMQTKHLGLGLTTGYNHFFAKENASSIGAIPLGAFVRYYPEAKGFFAGLDLGYSFLTNSAGANGGFYLKPQLGYHNYDWNFFGFYNNIFVSGSSISHLGIGATYNIRFK